MLVKEPEKQNEFSESSDIRIHTFIKEDNRWFIDLPEYIEQGGSKAELEMVAGADEMLSILAGKKKMVTLTMDTAPFEGADVLELVELCDAPMGGGYYVLKTYQGKTINRKMWLCDVTLFVFGDMPEKIFIRKEKVA
jgi:hypothetical protein